ncbi:MAG: hypothetical protein ACI841_002471 [Planctomycetota bacterium]|jgi:hypothetical protein
MPRQQTRTLLAPSMPSRSRLGNACALLALLSAPLIASSEGARDLHPSDGPDVDLRITIKESNVRASVTLNLAFIDEILTVARESEDSIHPAELEGLREDMVGHLRKHFRISVDDVAVTPVEHDFGCEPADESLLMLFPNAGARALIRVRSVLDFPVKAAPESVRIHWSDYPLDTAVADLEDALPLEVQMQLSINGSDQVFPLTIDDPSHLWRGSLLSPIDRFQAVPDVEAKEAPRLPLVSACAILLGLLLMAISRGRAFFLGIGAAFALVAVLARERWTIQMPFAAPTDLALPTSEQALAIFRPLHANIYRAFDYESESDVYDALARSANGELLDDLYNEIYSSLVLAEEGGAVCKVQRVMMRDASVDTVQRTAGTEQPVFDVTARWQVEGAVYHWGHSHWRTNEYQAQYRVQRGEDGWRIGESQILEQFRVSSSPTPPVPKLDPETIGEL